MKMIMNVKILTIKLIAGKDKLDISITQIHQSMFAQNEEI